MTNKDMLESLASAHWAFDWRMGNYIGRRGNIVYDKEYQRLSAREALRCTRCGYSFLNATERQWYDYYRQQNPV